MRRRIYPLLAVVLAVAGCSGGPTDPTPATTAKPPSTTASQATTSATTRPTVAPTVADPVDLTKASKHACATLTAAQQRQLGLPPQVGESVEGSHGSCHWRKEDAGLLETDYVLLLHVRPDLLAEAYENSNSREADGDPSWVLFEPRVIGGLPAVVRSFSTRADFCEVIVGVGEGQGIRMSGTVHEPDPDLCARLITAAEQVVTAVRR
jgi:hypothetical protein